MATTDTAITVTQSMRYQLMIGLVRLAHRLRWTDEQITKMFNAFDGTI